MHPAKALLPALGLLVSGGLTGAARAQTPAPSPAAAAVLEQQITSWMQSFTGADVKLPARPVQLTPEGDHYAVRVPLAELGLAKLNPADAAFTAKATPRGGTVWSLADQRVPSDLSFETREPALPQPGAKGPPPMQTVTYHLKIGAQDSSAVFDTAFATPASSSATIGPMDLERTDAAGAKATHFDQFAGQSSSRPVDPAHADLLVDATIRGFFTKSELPSGDGVTLTADRLHVTEALSGLAHAQVQPVAQAALALGRSMKAPAGRAPGNPVPGSAAANGPTPAQRAQLRALLVAAHDLLTGGKLEETLEGIKFDIGGHAGAMQKLEISFSGDSPNAMLSGTMAFVMDGLKVDELPPVLAIYLPTHFSIRPTVSNLNVAQLTKMGMNETAPPPAPGAKPVDHADDITPMFANGGIQFGFDDMAFDVAGTQFSGVGKFTASGPKTVSGEADITAHGLDDLIARAQNDPVLAQAVPVAIFLKGIAKVTGDQALWQVTLANEKMLVNGVDLSAMLGGPKAQ